MSMESDNVALLRRAYEAWSTKKGCDFDCWMSIVHDDVRLTSLASGAPAVPFTRPATGATRSWPTSRA